MTKSIYLLLFAPMFAFGMGLIRPETKLSPAGNREVLSMYSAFERSTAGCQARNNGPRILLTGFGLFEGLTYNMSGAVIENLASEAFWPADQEPASLPKLPQGYVFKDGVLTDADRGARIYNREVRLNGHSVNACLIIVDVLWDFAGAVFVREMERFQPDVVIMSGVGIAGEASIEGGALNTAILMPGFRDNGAEDHANTPVDSYILPHYKTGSTLPMTWNNQKLGPLVEPMLKKMNFRLNVPPTARAGNDYICNNVSYIALAAAAGHKLELAGGDLLLQPKLSVSPRIGFFHYPLDARKEQAVQFAQIILTMAAATLEADAVNVASAK